MHNMLRLIIAITLFATVTGCDGESVQIYDANPTTCPADTEREGEVCVRRVGLTCANGGPECPDGSECTTTGVCFQHTLDRTCKVSLVGPTPSVALKMPAAEVDVVHFNAVSNSGGAVGCDPQLMYLQYEIFTTRAPVNAANFLPTFQMTINGESASLMELAGGDITNQWYSRLYGWSGPFTPSENVDGEDIHLFCTNCSAGTMPNGIAVVVKVKGVRWSRSPLEAEQSVYENVGLEQLTIFAPPAI